MCKLYITRGYKGLAMKKILLILLVALGSLFANPAHASSCNAPIWQAQLANLADSVKSDWSLRGFKAARQSY
jgi:hypothetical protein